MKKFVFSLQKLQDFKENEEKQKRKELEELNKTLDGYKAVLYSLTQNFSKQREQYDKKCKEGIGAIDLKSFGDYFVFLNNEIKQQNNLIANCEAKIEVCKNELVKLMNEQKVLDRMREEQLAEYHIEVQKDSEKSIEDFMQAKVN